MLTIEIIDSRGKLKKFAEKLAEQRAFVFNLEMSGSGTAPSAAYGISFCFSEREAYYLDVASEKDWAIFLKKIFEDKKIEKFGHDQKSAVKVLAGSGINLEGIIFDTMIAAYLLNPGARDYDLDTIVPAKLGEKIVSLGQIIGTGRKKILPESLSAEKIAAYSCERAGAVWKLVEVLGAELEENNLLNLFREIEIPLIPVLAKMELDGVKIDAGLLEKKSVQAEKELAKISEKIFKAAKTKFNIDSPIQLRQVLFEKLKISTAGIGRGKTGLSTAAGELQKLKGAHPVIDLLMDYRELSKLRSTYFEALPKLVDPGTGRIHTSFNQTITATGRLSSSNPNLQNIPTRSEAGQVIREAFIASPGFKIMAADYAHIELRIIASMANDEAMIRAFCSGTDIHKQTASQIWGIPIEKVTPEIRQAAKTINFGVTYGMGARGLAEGAGITVEEARQFIAKYFTVYDGIRNFLDETKEKARDLGYVETLFGRRRYLPEIYSPIPMVRSEAERMAINMPVQGTAADLMKMAMIKIGKDLPKISPASKMIMQVHDELVFEVPEKEVGLVANFVKESMEKITELKVPVIAEVETGDNWGKTEKIKI